MAHTGVREVGDLSSEIRASVSVVVNRPIGEVWKFVVHVPHMDQWVKGISETRRPPDGEIDVGSTFTSKFIHGARTFDVTHRVTEHDPTSRFGTESTEGRSSTRASFIWRSRKGRPG